MLLALWSQNKPPPQKKASVCFPFVQFTELPEVSRPARPQVCPVKVEMERNLFGPDLPHHRRKGLPSEQIHQEGGGYRWPSGSALLSSSRPIEGMDIAETESRLLALQEIGLQSLGFYQNAETLCTGCACSRQRHRRISIYNRIYIEWVHQCRDS